MMNPRKQQQATLPTVRCGFFPLLVAAGVLAVVSVGTIQAGVFPDQAALTLKKTDGFEDGVAPVCSSCGYDEWETVSTTSMGFQNNSTTSLVTNAKGGSWGSRCVMSTGKSRSWWGYMLPKISVPGATGNVVSEWTNIQIEFDFDIRQFMATGVIWAGQDDDGDRNPDSGYLFRLKATEPTDPSYEDFPTNSTQVTTGARCTSWELLKITAENTYQTIGIDCINSNAYNPARPSTTFEVSDAADVTTKYVLGGQPYRMRVSWFCGNLRVQLVRVYNPVGTDPPVYYGCGAGCVGGSGDPEDCWCTVVEWSPLPLEQPLPPGAAGLWGSGTWPTSSGSYHFFDNVKFSYWDPDCGLVCGPWVGWGNARTDLIPFKFLYEGSLLDISAGRNFDVAADRGKIDVKTEAPASSSSYNHSADSNPYCNGWKLYEDLPDPTDTTGNVDDILAFLEPMYSAVDYESNGGSPPTFSWVDTAAEVIEDNPHPVVADGSTPINSSLLQAFDWYVDKKTNSSWSSDDFDSCRQWYVILITDGEEACEPSNPNAVCDTGGAAEKFANPSVTGVPPLPVYTIGFSQSVAEDSPLKCIADQTGGAFMTAESQSELKDALYEVFYEIEDQTRSFAPFKVAPPPSSAGGSPTRDYLAVFPLFQPLEGKSLWAGNLWAFPLNSSQPTLPTIGDCEVDTTQMVWNAADAVQAQVDAHSEADPKRFVYMGSDLSGSWQRYNLATMPDDTNLQTAFRSLLSLPAGITDLDEQKLIAQQIVNFVRDVYMDNDFDDSNAGPPLEPRPDGYPVLGEFFHSQPVVVNPPNNLQYYYDFGFGVSGEVGVHNYGDFITRQAKRRRLVLAGSNDGMLHAFDGGFWDRDRSDATETYNEIHDLGNGTELFAWVPQAVMPTLYDITSGGTLDHSTPKYLVDGPITKGDAFIDYDGDGDREWRTLALVSMRRGGRGIAALDITQADPTSGDDYIPELSVFPGCQVGSTAGCDGEFPKVLWELADTGDSDTNGKPDLGWTWSKPAIARIAVYNATTPEQPDDLFVAFFGGGWDQNEADETGNFLYCVDLETGTVLFRENVEADVPGGVTALDSDVDGFHDRIYFADSKGRVWRLQYPAPTSSSATGATAGTFTRIFDFNAGSPSLPDRQEFFTRPVPVPARFDGSNYTWGLALGSGDRANLDREDSGFDHFYFLIDGEDSTPRGIGDLVAIDYTDLNGGFDCTGLAEQPLTPPKYGWYLSLRENEKVMFDASVLNGYIFFPTFDPSTATATNPPNTCETSSGTQTRADRAVECRASGIGRTYKLWYECGLGEYTEHNDIITGQEVVDIDGESSVWSATSDPKIVPPKDDVLLNREHTVTNWRQE